MATLNVNGVERQFRVRAAIKLAASGGIPA